MRSSALTSYRRLECLQQPKRARMCGFGDKVRDRVSCRVYDFLWRKLTHLQDRRPITPPPCVRLYVTDLATGKEADCKYGKTIWLRR